MTALLWIGAAMTLAGLAGLGWCIRAAMRLKRNAPPPAEVRRTMNRLQAVNLASVSTAFLGLAVVVAALILG